MALSVLAMVALVAGTLLNSALLGSREQSDSRRRDLSAEAAGERIDAALRANTRVLGATASAVVLWRGDANGNGVPELSELLRVERDASVREIRAYQSPTQLALVDDVTYTLQDDFVAASAALRGTSRFPARLLAREVDEWSLTVVGTGPTPPGLVTYRLTQRDGAGQWTTAASVSLRNR